MRRATTPRGRAQGCYVRPQSKRYQLWQTSWQRSHWKPAEIIVKCKKRARLGLAALPTKTARFLAKNEEIEAKNYAAVDPVVGYPGRLLAKARHSFPTVTAIDRQPPYPPRALRSGSYAIQLPADHPTGSAQAQG